MLIGQTALALVAVVTAIAIDRATERRGLTPPWFLPGGGQPSWVGGLRRALAVGGLALVLWIGVFAPLSLLGAPRMVDFDGVPVWRLFQLHAVFAVFVVVWYVLGFVPREAGPAGAGGRFSAQLGFATRAPERASEPVGSRRPATGPGADVAVEIGLGLLLGIAAWTVAIGLVLLIGSIVVGLGGEDALPQQPPEMVSWLVGLPWLLRLAISLSAGVVEEAFFRGLLQPRCGVALSTILFVLAHSGYGNLLMLVAVTILSLLFAALVIWRQSLWAAMAAHTMFDAVQLLIVIPSLSEMLGGSGGAGTPLPGGFEGVG